MDKKRITDIYNEPNVVRIWDYLENYRQNLPTNQYRMTRFRISKQRKMVGLIEKDPDETKEDS